MRTNSDATWADLQHHVLNKMEENTNDIKALREELQSCRELQLDLKRSQETNAADIKQLLHLVRDGNGKNALVVSQELLESRVKILEETQKENLSREEKVRNINRSSMWSLLVALLLLGINVSCNMYQNYLKSSDTTKIGSK